MMYEMVRNNLESFIVKVESIANRMKYDENNSAFLDIKSIERLDGYYKLIGVVMVTLSPLCREKVQFKMIVRISKDRIIIKNEQVSKVESSVDGFLDDDVAGNKLETIDTFTIRNKANRRYLIHSADNEIKSIYKTGDDYKLEYGFTEEDFDLVSGDELKVSPKKRTRARIKSFIKNGLNF